MTAKFWDKRAQKYNDDIEKHDAVYMQTIESTISLFSTSDVVLDLGCASGEFSLDIAPRVQGAAAELGRYARRCPVISCVS